MKSSSSPKYHRNLPSRSNCVVLIAEFNSLILLHVAWISKTPKYAASLPTCILSSIATPYSFTSLVYPFFSFLFPSLCLY
ncbi:hypothetical protein V8C26DRAFT_9884 [Trichoderma gracile]